MQRLRYYILYSFLWVLSKLPWTLFYALSDIVCFFISRIIRYRIDIITDNLTHAFPNKTSAEIIEIRKKFYKHMCDMFLEMVKSISISEKCIKDRFVIKNLDTLNKLENSKNSTILLAGHYASYEWSNTIDLITKNNVVGVFKPVKNFHFNNLAKKIRGRFGSEIIPSKEIIKHIIKTEKTRTNNYLYGLVADQSPSNINAKSVSLPFMGRNVPVFVGAEAIAKKMNLNVAYLKVEKVKRGFYEAEVILISDNVTELNNYNVTAAYYKLLESQIYNRPEFYLWTHKRWKHAH